MSAGPVSPSNGRQTLSADDIQVVFGGFSALQAVSVEIRPGRITGFVGPNGAGKSTLFNVLAGSLVPSRGKVRLGAADITAMPVHRRARAGLARTFQLTRELGSLTVLENLLLGHPRHPGDALWNVFCRWRAVRRCDQEARDRAMALLERVGLAGLADDSAAHLSGGQKKLLELCRALMMDPGIILMDEPAAGVSPAMLSELIDVILSLQDDGQTFAIVEHNMEMVSCLCRWVYVLAEGRVLAEGAFDAVTSDLQVRQAYLGAGI